MAALPQAEPHRPNSALLLGALGIVYGDIGTSPIYTLRESFRSAGTLDSLAVLGVLSLVIWTVLIVVTFKYVLLVMRADNDGEGGIVALLSLALGQIGIGRSHTTLLMIGVFGASLFYGDGMITPAISVLSAIEGLQVATPVFQPYVVPITLAILATLFLVQHRGSGRIGKFFGPVMLVWFCVIGVVGLVEVVRTPSILRAVDPSRGLAFCFAEPRHAFVTLGSVFLAVTGAEALYADMSHFGRSAIRVDWVVLALPALVLNYAGQAALVLSDPSTLDNPFFHLVPSWGLYPLVLLSAAATVIASQAVISGAFSLTQQAMQLGLLPRLTVRQTSAESLGQIYVPQVNYLLMAAVFILVLAFKSSDALAAAYGIAVTGTMLITTVLLAVVMRRVWGWNLVVVALTAAALLATDLIFFSANALKIPQGGWVPLTIGAAMFTVMTTWRAGRRIVLTRLEEDNEDIVAFLDRIASANLHRVQGVGIYLTSRQEQVPSALIENLKHNQVLNERVILLKLVAERSPRVGDEDRMEHQLLSQGFEQVTFHIGFSESPDIPALLESHQAELGIDATRASFFIGREVPVPQLQGDMAFWREQVFTFLTRNSIGASDYFRVPTERVVELGTRVDM